MVFTTSLPLLIYLTPDSIHPLPHSLFAVFIPYHSPSSATSLATSTANPRPSMDRTVRVVWQHLPERQQVAVVTFKGPNVNDTAYNAFASSLMADSVEEQPSIWDNADEVKEWFTSFTQDVKSIHLSARARRVSWIPSRAPTSIPAALAHAWFRKSKPSYPTLLAPLHSKDSDIQTEYASLAVRGVSREDPGRDQGSEDGGIWRLLLSAGRKTLVLAGFQESARDQAEIDDIVWIV